MPIDPTRYIVNKRKVFTPSLNDRTNRMVYVIAVEEDGYCRDVTARYARDYGTKTAKAQLGGKGRKEWWESVMKLVTRPYRLVRDDVEDAEFEYFKTKEGMPTSVAGFKNHPLYVPIPFADEQMPELDTTCIQLCIGTASEAGRSDIPEDRGWKIQGRACLSSVERNHTEDSRKLDASWMSGQGGCPATEMG